VVNLEANIPERPEFLDFIALNDLSPMNNIERLAGESAEFTSDDVPEGRVFEAYSTRQNCVRSSSIWIDFQR
jgi:hypothetical protein